MKRRLVYILPALFGVTALVFGHHYATQRTCFKSHCNIHYYCYPDRWTVEHSGLNNALDAALFNAVIENNVTVAQQLIAQGANVNALVDHDQPHWGYTPLKIAIDNNYLAMAKLLIEAGANVNESTDTDGIADEIFKHPTDDVRNNTLLSYAIILNKPEMVQLLLQHGADVHKPDPIFTIWTPLMIARYNKRDKIIKILIDAGAQ